MQAPSDNVRRLPLEGGGPNAMGLARPTQISQQARGRAKSLVFGVGVSGRALVAHHPHPERQRLGPAPSALLGPSWPVQTGDVPPSPLTAASPPRGRRQARRATGENLLKPAAMVA